MIADKKVVQMSNTDSRERVRIFDDAFRLLRRDDTGLLQDYSILYTSVDKGKMIVTG